MWKHFEDYRLHPGEICCTLWRSLELLRHCCREGRRHCRGGGEEGQSVGMDRGPSSMWSAAL